jgi:hypothetical protein
MDSTYFCDVRENLLSNERAARLIIAKHSTCDVRKQRDPLGTAPVRKDGPRLVRQSEPEITHDGYERIIPGEYRAYCRAARIYRDPGFQKWVCVLRWDILDPTGIRKLAQVPQWLYIGRKPHATRRAQFWREWCRANGGPPSRKDRMSAAVFHRRVAHVFVDDSRRPTEKSGRPTPHVPYSVVRRINEWEVGRGGRVPPYSSPISQSSIPK